MQQTSNVSFLSLPPSLPFHPIPPKISWSHVALDPSHVVVDVSIDSRQTDATQLGPVGDDAALKQRGGADAAEEGRAAVDG